MSWYVGAALKIKKAVYPGLATSALPKLHCADPPHLPVGYPNCLLCILILCSNVLVLQVQTMLFYDDPRRRVGQNPPDFHERGPSRPPGVRLEVNIV